MKDRQPELLHFVCPKCAREHRTIGGVVWHFCPKNREKPTRFTRQASAPEG